MDHASGLSSSGLAELLEIRPTRNKTAWSSKKSDDAGLKAVQNALPILQKYSKNLAGKFKNDSELRFNDLSDLEKAKFKAAEKISLSDFDMDTKNNFGSLRRHNELHLVEAAQFSLNKKFRDISVGKDSINNSIPNSNHTDVQTNNLEACDHFVFNEEVRDISVGKGEINNSSLNSTHTAVQTTLRKIDDWVEQDILTELKENNSDAYEQFLFDVYMMGAKRTKNGVVKSLRRATNDPVLVHEERSLEIQNTLEQSQIDALAEKIREPLMVGELIKSNKSTSNTENAKRVARFLLVHMPDSAAIIDKTLDENALQQEKSKKILGKHYKNPDIYDDAISKKNGISPIYGLLAVIGQRTSTNDSSFEEDVYLAIAQKDFSRSLVTYKADEELKKERLHNELKATASGNDSVVLNSNITPKLPTNVLPLVPRQEKVKSETSLKTGNGFFGVLKRAAAFAVALFLAPLALSTEFNDNSQNSQNSTTNVVDPIGAGHFITPEKPAIEVQTATVFSSTIPSVREEFISISYQDLVGDNVFTAVPVMTLPIIPEGSNVTPLPSFNSVSYNPAYEMSALDQTDVMPLQLPISDNERLLASDFTFEQIPDVITAYYEMRGIDISTQLQTQMDKVPYGLENNHKGHAEDGAFTAIKIAEQEFGADFVNAYGYRSLDLIQSHAPQDKNRSKRTCR